MNMAKLRHDQSRCAHLRRDGGLLMFRAMFFSGPLEKGVLIKRYKRFLADVKLDSGDTITAHCANPGSMMGLADPGTTVWLSKSDNPKRKLAYSWELLELARNGQTATIGINTSHPNTVVSEAIENGAVSELTGYGSLRREVRYGRNSRIDILLEDDSKPPCYVEIKNVHLLREGAKAEFPDSVTARGAKHLEELADMVADGARAVMFYLVQRDDTESFSLARDIDPHYAETFDRARARGVEAICYDCRLTNREIVLNRRIPITD